MLAGLAVLLLFHLTCGQAQGLGLEPEAYQVSTPAVLVLTNQPVGAVEAVLGSHGIAFTSAGSDQMGAIDLVPYRLVIVPSLQNAQFYTDWNANLLRFEDFVQSGGALWLSTAAMGTITPRGQVPGGLVNLPGEDGTNLVKLPSHPWALDVPEQVDQTLASMNAFGSLPADALVVMTDALDIATGDLLEAPTLVDYRLGQGRVMLTGQPLEIAHDGNWNGKQLLENTLLDLFFWTFALETAPLSSLQVPGKLVERTLQVCNPSSSPWSWSAVEQMPVLILQDTAQPASTAIQDILIRAGVVFDLLPFAGLATLELERYGLVIVPGGQLPASIQSWNTHSDKIEAYVQAGGRLWMIVSDIGDPETVQVLPGGLTYTAYASPEINLLDVDHPWIFGLPSGGVALPSHGFLQSLPLSAQMLAAADNNEAALVDYALGRGRVFLSTAAIEQAWDEDAEGGIILQNALLDLLADAATAGVSAGNSASTASHLRINPLTAPQSQEKTVLIIRDTAAGVIENILTDSGILFDSMDSAGIPTLNLNAYHLVIIPGSQALSFYAAWNAALAKFEAYLAAGGALWFSAVKEDAVPVNLKIPGGVKAALDNDTTNFVRLTKHPWMTNVDETIYATPASRFYFTDLVDGSIVLTTESDAGDPTLLDYRLGLGRVLVSGLPLEQAYADSENFRQILRNSLLDLADWEPGVDLSWLEVDQNSGTSAGNTCVDLTLQFNSTGLVPGDYQALLSLRGTSPQFIPLQVPLSLEVVSAIADFSAEPLVGITPLLVAFSNETEGVYDSCLWDFGDGQGSTDSSPTHAYTQKGLYSVSLTVTTSSQESAKIRENYIIVYQAVDADFNVDPASGIAPLTVSFTNTSTGDYESCQWDFGDGSTAIGCGDQVHTYKEAGKFTVSLQAAGLGGEDTEIKADLIQVYAPVQAVFFASVSTGTAPLTVTFSNTSSGDYDSCQWDFGDGSQHSGCGNPSHTYTSAGDFTVSLNISGFGGTSSHTEQIQVLPPGAHWLFLPAAFR